MRPETKQALDELKGYVDAICDFQDEDAGIPYSVLKNIQDRLGKALLMEKDPVQL